MTDEQINIAIAEYRGWQILEPEVHKAITYHWAIEPDGSKSILPDCCNDLNAMHEAEKVLIGDEPENSELWCDFQTNLVIACPAYLSYHATAAQRAEAFVKTIGKWKE